MLDKVVLFKDLLHCPRSVILSWQACPTEGSILESLKVGVTAHPHNDILLRCIGAEMKVEQRHWTHVAKTKHLELISVKMHLCQ